MKISDRPDRGWELALDDPFPGQAPREASSPLYVRIVRAVTRDIRRGRLVPGQALPGSRTLAEQLGVHRNTVLAAYAELAAEGWIETRPAHHTVVCQALPETPRGVRAPARTPRERLGFDLPERRPPLCGPPSDVTSLGDVTSLSDGTPDLRLLPRAALARAYRRVLGGKDPSVLAYGDARGHVRLRRALAGMLRATRGLGVREDDVFVTRGSQMALELAARALLARGDVVAVEALGYRPAWRALASTGAKLVPVEVDAEGIRVERLAALTARRRLRAVYVTPHHQYPTTATLSAARRLALLALAREQRFAVIEDDYDHEFHYQGRPVLPLASADEAGVVVYIGTLSKILAPGLRLGYVAAPRPVLEAFGAARESIDRQGDAVVECAVAELIEEGELQRHARRMRRVYRARRDALLENIERHLGGSLEVLPASGGMAVWARAHGLDLERWIARAGERGILLSPERAYSFAGSPGPHVRLGFALRSAEESARLLQTLARLRPERRALGRSA